ncbi:amidohydrolase family protein [Halocola ammonii]
MKNFLSITLLLLVSLVPADLSAQRPTPAPAQSESILILGATAHVGNGEKMERSAIGFENGKITYVGYESQVDVKMWDRVIDAHGKDLYPGFIAPNNTLGLVEIGAVRATRDQREVGDFNPHIRSIIAYNTDSKITPTIRTNGVLMGQITPRGNVVSGTSSVVHFDAWNWEDAVVKMDDGIHLNWPRVYEKEEEKGPKVELKVKDDYAEEKREIIAFFDKARAYSKLDSPKETDLRFEAMREIFSGEKNLYIHAHDVKQITEAVNFMRNQNIPKRVIVGGYDAHLVGDMLRDNNVSVMIRRTHELPRFRGDDINLPYRLPKLLADEGVMFCFDSSGGMEQMQARNLPFWAGTAVAFGLTYEQAVQALTLNTAKILGVDDRCGSIAEGKDATIFISEGDALDMRTNDVTFAFIQGREIALTNHQIQLYEQYKEKYER